MELPGQPVVAKHLSKEFINGFANLGFLQCINESTHKKGNTLDILLTKSFSYIKDLKIIDTERYCISDHFAITFVITETIKRKPRVKRKCYNYNNCWSYKAPFSRLYLVKLKVVVQLKSQQ